VLLKSRKVTKLTAAASTSWTTWKNWALTKQRSISVKAMKLSWNLK